MPARFDDDLVVETTTQAVTGARLVMKQDVRRGSRSAVFGCRDDRLPVRQRPARQIAGKHPLNATLTQACDAELLAIAAGMQ